MNHCIHLADLIDLAGEVSRLREVCKIPDCRDRSLIHKVSHGGEASLGANMDDDLVSIGEQRFSRSMSKSVSGAGDENTSFPVRVQRRWRRSLFFRRFKGLARWTLRLPKEDLRLPQSLPSPATRNLRRSMDEPCISSEFWVVCKVDVG